MHYVQKYQKSFFIDKKSNFMVAVEQIWKALYQWLSTKFLG